MQAVSERFSLKAALVTIFNTLGTKMGSKLVPCNMKLQLHLTGDAE